MDEREILIAEVTEEATTEAKAQKLNAGQTKLYVSEKVKEAVAEFDKTQESETIIPIQDTPQIPVNESTEIKKDKSVKQAETNVKEQKYIVYTPVKNFCGVIAKVHFAYGKAEVKPGWILNWFKEHGYKVEEVSE